MKKLLIFLGLVTIATFIYLNDANDKQIPLNNKEINANSNVEKNTKAKESKIIENTTEPESIDYESLSDGELISQVANCGFNELSEFEEMESLFDEANIDINNLGETQQVALNNYQYNAQCEEWNDFSQTMNKQEKERIKILMDKENSKALEFSLSNDFKSKMELSKRILAGEDDSFHENVALGFLLKNDRSLIELIASEINTENLNYIQNKATDILQIYECKKNYKLCSKNSRKMAFKCLLSEKNCNIDYITYLEKKRSINEVADLHNMVSALMNILESGYPFNSVQSS